MSYPIRRSLVGFTLLICALGLPARSHACVWVSRQGKFAAFNDYGGVLSVWNLADGTESCRIIMENKEANIGYCAISESAGLIATSIVGGSYREMRGVFVWNLQTGEQLWRDQRLCGGIEFYPDGRHLITVSENERHHAQELLVRRAIDGSHEESLALGEAVFSPYAQSAVALSPDGDRIYAYALNGYNGRMCVRGWDGESGIPLGELALHEKFDAVGSFSVGNDFIAQSVQIDYKHKVILWDANTWTEVRRFDVNPRYKTNSLAKAIVLREEQERVFVPVDNNFIEEFDLRTGNVMSKFEIPLNGEPFISNSAPCPVFGTDLIVWENRLSRYRDGIGLLLGRRSGPSSGGIAASFQIFKEAGQTAVILSDGITGLVRGRPQPKQVFELRVTAASKNSNGHTLEVKTSLTPTSSIQQNPQAVHKVLADLNRPSPIQGGKKPVDRSKPRLFLLGIGISDHQQDDFDLKHAAQDAQALSARFEKERGRSFGDVQVKIYTDQQATPDAIREGLSWLIRSSTPKDIVIAFFSGHGIRAKKGLYYVSHTGDEDNIQNTCVNWSEVAGTLAETKAAQIVFLSDCCHAGAFSKERYINQDELAKAIDRSEQLTILASSTGDEKSVELDGNLRHGAFTQALLEGLDGRADSDQNGQITWIELEIYAGSRVPDLTDGEQHPTVLKTAKDVATVRLALTSGPANPAAPSRSSALQRAE